MRKGFAVLLLSILFAAAGTVPFPAGAAPVAPEAGIVPSIAERSRQADRKKYPDADNVLLWEKERYTYEPSGVYRAVDEFYVKCLTEKGRQELRTLDFSFCTHYNRIKVERITVIRPDGKRVEVDPARHSRVVIDPSQMASNIYDPAWKNLTVLLPRLEVGDVLYCRVTDEHFKPRIPGFWSSYTMLQSTWPIVENIIEIEAPAALPLRSVALKDEVKGTVKYRVRKEKDRTIHRWRACDVPQVIREPGMPALHSCVQRLLVSTAASWEEVSRWYWNLCRPRLDAVTPAMRQCVASLIKGKKTDMEKIRAVFQFVSQNCRYMGITPEKEAPGYEPHDVSLTFDRRYGVCRDKAALLAAMLELAGFKAYPVLFMAGDPKDDEIPNGYFNHAITAVELEKDKFIYMDPTYESTTELLPAFEADMSCLVAHPQGRKLRRSPPVPAEKNRTSVRTRARLDAGNTLSGESEISLSGANDIYYRGALSRWPVERRTEFFLNRLRTAMPGARIIELKVLPENIRDMSKPLKFLLRYSVPVRSASSEWLVQMPGLAGVFGINEAIFGDVELLTRKYPLKLFTTCLAEEEYAVELPPTCRIRALPGSEHFGVGKKIRWKLETGLEGRILKVKKRFSVDALELSAREYAELKKALSRLDTFRAALPLAVNDYALENDAARLGSFPGADSVIEEEATAVTVKDAANWQVKNNIRRRILNYAGVKAHSEVKIPYVPAWENVSLTARVTGADGKTRRIGKGEINIMDAPRNGAGPRYPPGKILVASLPGVAPGSTIDLEVCVDYRDRNFFHASVPFFSFTAPVIRRRLELLAPDRFPLKVLQTGLEGFACDIRRQEFREGKMRRWIWEARSVPRLKNESSLPPWRFFAPGVHLSAGNNRTYAAKLNAALLARCEASLPAARRLVAELKWDRIKDPAEAVRAVRDHVDKFIRDCPVSPGEIPFSAMNTADVTLSSGYGNSADKAILLGAVLKVLGVAFEFVGTGGIGYAAESAASYNHAPDPEALTEKILLHLPALKWYLNDTGRFAAPGAANSEGRLGLDLGKGRLIGIQVPPALESSRQLQFTMVCKPDLSVEIAAEEKLSGSEYEAVKRELETATPERRRRFFEVRASAVSHGARLLGPGTAVLDVHPGVLRYRFTAEGLISGVGDYRVLMLPRYGMLRDRGAVPSTSDRSLPYWRNRGSMLKINYLITPPPGFRVVPGRAARLEIGRYGSAQYTENYSADSKQILLRCRSFLPVEWVGALDYCELENRQSILSLPAASRIVMKKIADEKRSGR